MRRPLHRVELRPSLARRPPRKPRLSCVLIPAVWLLCTWLPLAAAERAPSQDPQPAAIQLATVPYQLPTDGPLPKTYRVTLAITDAKNPDWIVSTFVAGTARTVTRENQGRFTETWDGLDDNFMPVPPGDYGVKGIVMPARHWPVDGQWHSVTPKFAGGASPWLPAPEQADRPEPFGGDPVGAPLADVAVGANGVAVFYYTYLENGLNCPLIDLHQPLGYGQFLRAFNSGGAGGGSCATTDGQTVWAFSTDGGPKFVYRADGKSFGTSHGANRANAYLPPGWVTAMAHGRDAATEQSLVCVAQRGKIIEPKPRHYAESDQEFVDKITVHDGDDGRVLAELPLSRPQGLAVRDGVLYALHQDGQSFVVSSVKVANSGVAAVWRREFQVPAKIRPGDLEIDSRGRFYLSDAAANKVYQLDGTGKVVRSFGRLDGQKPGSFDTETLMEPGKLATWTDSDGQDRLLIVDNAGPNRVTEWNADGRFLREFLSLQTNANDGYAVDPERPEHVYLPGHRGWLTRFRVDYTEHSWTIDAVWPYPDNEPRSPKLDRASLIRSHGRIYLAGRRSFNVFRLDADRCVLSAAILRERHGNAWKYAFWNDANDNGRIDEDEVRPAELPGHLLTYHGQNWCEDLSLLALNQGGRELWRLAPSGFDAHGNPIFTEFQKVLTDPIFEARAAGRADAVHGGNELADNFPSDWMEADGSPAEGFYVQARGGKNFSANEGAQHKISRYVPDGSGGYRLRWRTGRTALQGLAQPGEIYGAMRIRRPINGLLSVVDQSRCGVLLYTDDGLYVDTVFPDGRRYTPQAAGMYAMPGEFFAGAIFPNRTDGKIYFAMGKYTPLLFEAEGWSLQENPVRRLTTLPPTVSISAAQIAAPPEIALSLRGGAGTAKVARFAPALGGAAFDGSLRGWETAEPVRFQADQDHSVEVRCLYDPQQLLLRWHARLAAPFAAQPLPPLERIFTHDRRADTLSFYLQGDAQAKPGGPLAGRPGDVRFVFGLFQQEPPPNLPRGTGKEKDGRLQPVGIGLYPAWTGPGKASPQTYRTPVGQASFAHVGPIPGAKLAHTVDADGKGFVIVAGIPRAAVPSLQRPFGSGLRTMANFEATFGGHNKFWWANSDGSASRETYDEPTEARLYPGSWAPVLFQGLEGGVVVRHWRICGPFGGAGATRLTHDPNGKLPGTDRDWKQVTREFCEAASYPPDNGQVDLQTVFQGEQIRGYWPDPREVRWKPASVADLDTRVILGPSGQVWYGSTWLHVPAAVEVELQFHGHPMTPLRWFLNGQRLGLGKPSADREDRPVTAKSVRLQPGWNHIQFRGYCIGYPPFRAGVVVNAPAETLWHIGFASDPPADE